MRQASSWSGMLGFPRSGKNWQSSVHDVTSLVWPGPGPGPATTELWDRASGRTQVSIPAWGVRDGRRVPGCQTEPWPLVSHTGGGEQASPRAPPPAWILVTASSALHGPRWGRAPQPSQAPGCGGRCQQHPSLQWACTSGNTARGVGSAEWGSLRGYPTPGAVLRYPRGPDRLLC